MTIQFKQVEFSYPAMSSPLLVVDELKIQNGSKVFLHGRSGCGKTTLLSLIAGILTPTNGSIDVLGQRISEMKDGRRDEFRADHMGFIFQIFNLIPYLSIIENILLTTRFSKARRAATANRSRSIEKEAKRLLTAMELSTDEDFLAKKVHELSLGQQQRVAAARAFIGSPDIIIADEPTSALDEESRNSFLNILFEECQQNATTLIYVSHDSSKSDRFDAKIDLHLLNQARTSLS